jgi:hypothetical protein
MHNGQLADPLNTFAKELKKLTDKKDKTDADIEEIARVEWFGGLYLHDSVPCLPGDMVLAVLVQGARKKRQGKKAESGIYCVGNFPLEHEGPSDLESLWEDGRFRLRTWVRVMRNRVMRTRPKFDIWSATVTVTYNDAEFNAADIDGLFNVAGEQVGLGDWRPRYGRFQAVQVA